MDAIDGSLIIRLLPAVTRAKVSNNVTALSNSSARQHRKARPGLIAGIVLRYVYQRGGPS